MCLDCFVCVAFNVLRAGIVQRLSVKGLGEPEVGPLNRSVSGASADTSAAYSVIEMCMFALYNRWQCVLRLIARKIIIALFQPTEY